MVQTPVHIPQQNKEEVAGSHTSLINALVNNPQHLLIYTNGPQTKNGSNGTGMIAILLTDSTQR